MLTAGHGRVTLLLLVRADGRYPDLRRRRLPTLTSTHPASLARSSSRTAARTWARVDARASAISRIISAQSASGHLSKLVDGGLLRAETSGRQRLYRIAKPEVAYALEALGTIATASPVRNIVSDPRIEALRTARTCSKALSIRTAGFGRFRHGIGNGLSFWVG